MPHFLLTASGSPTCGRGHWQFALEGCGRKRLEVEDFEPFTQGQRLELFAVIRGLEALEQPSQVTLLTASTYVKRGIIYGLDDWRASGWCWESHGKMVPVKNGDLWQRLDRALQVHSVECRLQMNPGGGHRKAAEGDTPGLFQRERDKSAVSNRWIVAAFGRRIREFGAALRLRLAQFGTGLLPQPWLD